MARRRTKGGVEVAKLECLQAPVGKDLFAHRHRGGSGTASGATSWSVSGIALQSGTNVITVTASDAANNTATDTLTVLVTVNPVAVSDIDYDTAGPDDRDLLVFVEVADDNGDELSGASVSIEVFRDGVLAANGMATTDESGLATFTLANAQSGTYVTEITNVTAEGFAWDGLTPENNEPL